MSEPGPVRLGRAASRARDLLSRGRAAVLVLPGLWGVDAVTAAVAEHGPIIPMQGNEGSGEGYGDVSAGVASLRAARGEPIARRPLDEDLREWSSFCAAGGVVLVRAAHRLDEASADLLASTIRESAARVLVLMAAGDELCPPLSELQDDGDLTGESLLPFEAAELATVLEEELNIVTTSAMADRIHALTGGHPELVDLMFAAAASGQAFTWRAGGWAWDCNERALRASLLPMAAGVLATMDRRHAELIEVVGLAGMLTEDELEDVAGESAIVGLRGTRILARVAETEQGGSLIGLAPELLRWVVLDSTSDAEAAAGWYAFIAKAGEAASSERPGIAEWRMRAEGVPPPASMTRSVRAAIASGALEQAEQLIAAMPEGHQPLRLLVSTARLAWAGGDVDEAFARLEAGRESLWGDSVAGADADAIREATLLLMHMALFHPCRAAALLVPELAPVRTMQSADGRPALVAEAFAGLRSSGLSVMPELFEHLLIGDDERAFALVRRHGLDVGFEESILARLWLGVSIGVRGGNDRGRRMLSELLDELRRNRAPEYYADSVHAVLTILSMLVGWRVEEPHVDRTGRMRARSWKPGLQTAQHLVRAVVAMQEDGMSACLRHALSAVIVTDRMDPYGLREMALALVAASASYQPEDAPEHQHGARAREELEMGMQGALTDVVALDTPARLGGFRYLAHLAEGMALIGCGLPTEQVSALIYAVSQRAHRARSTAEQQQLLYLAVLGGHPGAIDAVLSGIWRAGGARRRMIVMTALGIAATDESVDSALEIAETLLAAGMRFSAHAILHVQWQRQESPSRRLVELVLHAHALASEPSWLLGRFASELRLGERDVIVLHGLRDGERTATIARRLSLSPRTVEGHISRMLGRFGCESRLELVQLLEEFLPADG